MSRLLHLANAQPLDPSGVTASFLRGSCKEIKPQPSLPEPGRSYLLLGFLNWFARFPEQDKKTKWPRHVTHIKVPLLRLSPTTALSSVPSIKAGVQIIKSLTNSCKKQWKDPDSPHCQHPTRHGGTMEMGQFMEQRGLLH